MERALYQRKLLLPIIAALCLAFVTDSAFAEAITADIYENVLDRFKTASNGWATIILMHASRLFWTLALISMVWTFGMMALRRADIGEFFAEFVRFTIFTGLFWWFLLNGPRFGETIIASLRQIGGEATGLGPNLTPSSVVDIGFSVFFVTLDLFAVSSPVMSSVGILLGFGVLVLLALVAVNMLILLVSGWVLLYGGVFFLGFGGARWTSDLAINYYKTVLGLAASLFAMVLIVGVATSIIDQYHRSMAPDLPIKELAVVMMVAFIMAMLVKSIPPLISGIITGASINQPGSLGFGAGAIVGATSMAAAAVATGSAALVAGASKVAGGTQALMAAYRKGASPEGIGDDPITDLMASSRANSSIFDGGDAYDRNPMPSTAWESPTPMASGFRQDNSAESAAGSAAGKWKHSVGDRGHPMSTGAVTGHAGRTDAEPGAAEIFDDNHLTQGKDQFNFAAPEVRDFVNRSQPSS